MSYHAYATIDIGFRCTQDLVCELSESGCLDGVITYHMEEYAWWISCRDSKRIVDAVERWMQVWPKLNGLNGQLDPWEVVAMGQLSAVLKSDFGKHMRDGLLMCGLTGLARKKMVWALCAEYRFVFA